MEVYLYRMTTSTTEKTSAFTLLVKVSSYFSLVALALCVSHRPSLRVLCP